MSDSEKVDDYVRDHDAAGAAKKERRRERKILRLPTPKMWSIQPVVFFSSNAWTKAASA